MLTGGLALQGNAMAFTGMGGTLLVGQHGGRLRPIRRRDRRGIAGALPASDGTLVVFGEFGVERISEDPLSVPQ